MVTQKSFILIIGLATGCSAVTHHRIQKTSLLTNTAFVVCDTGQTLYMSNGGKWDRGKDTKDTVDGKASPGSKFEERNPLMGPHPSQPTIVMAMAIGLAANVLVYKSNLPDWIKTSVLAGATLIEGFNVAVNYGGVCGLNNSIMPMMDWHTKYQNPNK